MGCCSDPAFKKKSGPVRSSGAKKELAAPRHWRRPSCEPTKVSQPGRGGGGGGDEGFCLSSTRERRRRGRALELGLGAQPLLRRLSGRPVTAEHLTGP